MYLKLRYPLIILKSDIFVWFMEVQAYAHSSSF